MSDHSPCNCEEARALKARVAELEALIETDLKVLNEAAILFDANEEVRRVRLLAAGQLETIESLVSQFSNLRALVGELVEAYEDQCAMEPDRDLVTRARKVAAR